MRSCEPFRFPFRVEAGWALANRATFSETSVACQGTSSGFPVVALCMESSGLHGIVRGRCRRLEHPSEKKRRSSDRQAGGAPITRWLQR